MSSKSSHLFPAHRARHLDGKFRKFMNNPKRLLANYVKPGMRVMDFGCGPGFFTLPLAHLVKEGGHVIAADLQQEMLDLVQEKVGETALDPRIYLHQTTEERIGAGHELDLVLAFHVLHEVPNPGTTLQELFERLRTGGSVLVVEPRLHVTKKKWNATLVDARKAGFSPEPGPYVFMGRSVVLRKPWRDE